MKRGGYAALRKVLGMTPEAVIEEVKASGLRGRGGAGFPTGLKWSLMPKNDGKPHYLVCNADESEPGTFKDRELLRWTPHQLLEGCAIGAYAIGAERCYIYIRGEFTEPCKIMERAVDEAYANGALGANVLRQRQAGRHRAAPRRRARTSAGKRPAMLNSLEGRRGNPRIKPPYPRAGRRLRHADDDQQRRNARQPCRTSSMRGGEWYKGSRSAIRRAPGPSSISICGHIQRPGNYEVTMGTPLRDILYDMAGGPPAGREFKAIIPGGSSVPIMTRQEAEAAIFDYEGIVARARCSAPPADRDGRHDRHGLPDLAPRAFYAHESCAQCTQCREGTAWTVRRARADFGRPGERCETSSCCSIWRRT